MPYRHRTKVEISSDLQYFLEQQKFESTNSDVPFEFRPPGDYLAEKSRESNTDKSVDSDIFDNLDEVEIKETYLCQLPNGNWLKAQILDKRIHPESLKPQYYAHFEGVDRRLDQWLDVSNIDTTCEKHKPEKNSDEPVLMTRHQKRTYDDRNHVT